jgi:ABC-type branched-subunit amino acid transport system substrate-binding protein
MRRNYSYAVVLCHLFLSASDSARGQERTLPDTLRIGLLTAVGTNPQAQSIERGVRLGAAEAKQTANLFGDDVQLYEASAGNDVVAAASRLLSQRQVQVLIGASATDANALSKLAEQRRIVVLNVASRAQSLRAACGRYTFHVEASDAMYANAALLGRQASTRSLGAVLSGSAEDSVVLWGAGLERYGASQINDRYRARYRTGMDGNAWAGWVAVKIIAEAALRARSSEPDRLIEYLENPATSFDGHKGWPLSFRFADHQLRQPLYVMTRARGASRAAFRDVPELRGTTPQENPQQPTRLNQLLDRLIASPTAPRCHWVRIF